MAPSKPEHVHQGGISDQRGRSEDSNARSFPDARNPAFSDCGFGSSAVAVSTATDGLELGVGFYADQVYHARLATAAFDIAEIEQVEEQRGPQGTLFGKDTITGAPDLTREHRRSRAMALPSYSMATTISFRPRAGPRVRSATRCPLHIGHFGPS